MVLNENKNCNTVGLCYSLRNQDERSTVIRMSTSLLIQSIPDFEDKVPLLPHLKAYVIFSCCWFYFLFQSWHHWRCTAVLQERWATGCLVGYRQHYGRLFFVCAIAHDCFILGCLPLPTTAVRWDDPRENPGRSATRKPCHHSALPEWCALARDQKWTCSRMLRGWQAARRQACAVCPAAVV